MKVLLFLILVSLTFGQHSDHFVKSRRFIPSELFISGRETVQLVFYIPLEGVMDRDKDATEFLVQNYPVRAPTKLEVKMFLDLYSKRVIQLEAKKLKLPEITRYIVIVNTAK